MFPKHGNSQKIINDGSKLERWMPWDPLEYQKRKIRNVTIRQQIGLEEPIIKEIEQNQQCLKNGRRKITQNSIEVDA